MLCWPLCTNLQLFYFQCFSYDCWKNFQSLNSTRSISFFFDQSLVLWSLCFPIRRRNEMLSRILSGLNYFIFRSFFCCFVYFAGVTLWDNGINGTLNWVKECASWYTCYNLSWHFMTAHLLVCWFSNVFILFIFSTKEK